MDRFELSSGFEAYKVGSKFYSPLSEIVSGFEFPINVDSESGKAIGWFISEERPFHMDLKKKKVRSNIQVFSVMPEDVLWGAEDIFIETSFFEKLFPVEAEIDPLTLVLKFKGLEPMPFEEKLEREKRQKMLDKSRFKTPQFTDHFIENSAWFTFPSIDFSLNAQRQDQRDHTNEFLSYSFSGNAILMGMDTGFNFFGSTNSDKRYARFKMSRFMPTGGPAHLKYFEAGDVSSYNIGLISSGSQGRGISMSSFNEKSNAIEQNFFLTGLLTQGWEVELYQNNTLKDFSTGDGSGQYFFRDIPLSLGANKLKLIFYGPQGEQREEERMIYISPTSVDPGEFGFRLYAHERTMPLIPLNDEQVRGKEVGFYGEYGLLQQLSLTLGSVLFKRTEETPESQEYDEEMIMLGLRGGFSHFRAAISGAYSENTHSPAFKGIFETEYGGYSIFAEHNKYNGIRSSDSFVDSEFVDSLSRLYFQGQLPIPFIGSIPFFSRYTVASNSENKKYKEISNRLSLSFWHFYFSLENKIKQQFSSVKENLFIPSLNFRYKSIAIRGTGRYDSRENYLQSTSVGFDWTGPDRLLFQTNWLRNNNLLNESLDNYSFSISKGFPFGNLSAGFSFSSNNSQTIQIGYNASILHNPLTGEIFLSESGDANRASVVTRSYLDNDYSDSFTAGDEVLENIAYNGARLKKRENLEQEEKFTFMKGGTPYNLTQISLDTDTLDDIAYYPEKKSLTVLPRIGTATPVDFIIQKLGEIDGEVMLKDSKRRRKLSGIRILLKKGEQVITSGLTDSDGYYNFRKLQPGRYRLIFDHNQMNSLGLKSYIVGFEIGKEDLYKTIPTIYLQSK